MRWFALYTANREAGASPSSAGKQGQIPIPGLHLADGRSGKFLQAGHLIVEAAVFRIGKDDGITDLDILQSGKMCPVVMSREDHVIQIGGALILAGGEFQKTVAPLADMAKKRANGEGNIRKRKDGRW